MNKQRIENSDYFEIVALEPKYECMKSDYEFWLMTNQEATANHTAKMFNQSRTQWLASDGNPVNEPKEIKMTRKEAKQKLQMVGSLEADKALDMLEALGLIKFDEEKSIVDVLNAYTYYPSTLLELLDKHGYKIVKK